MDFLTGIPRARSDSMSSSASQGSRSKMLLRQRLTQLLTRIDDMSSDDEASEEVSRSLDEAFQLCGHYLPTDTFRSTHAHGYSRIHKFTQMYAHTEEVLEFFEMIESTKSRSHVVKTKLLWSWGAKTDRSLSWNLDLCLGFFPVSHLLAVSVYPYKMKTCWR